MQQTQSALISELEFGIKHLPPTLPEDKLQEIDKKVADLNALGDQADDGAVRDVMIATGMIEWPYRQAYKAMSMACCSQTEHQMLVENLRPATSKKFKDIGGDDVSIHELTRSRIFEEKLTPEERYEVQEASLNARFQMIEFMKEQVKNRPKELEERLVEAFANQKKLEDAIDKLEALAQIDPDWAPDIQGKVDQLKLGWSISEPDASLGDVEKEIEYWQETLAASESEV